MKPVNICVPVLKRYDLLKRLIDSLRDSTVQPDVIYIFDNGRDNDRLSFAVARTYGIRFVVHTPDERVGLAEAWNWFIDNVSEERFIVNDDIEFAPESLAQMLAPPNPFVSVGFGFSCFLLRDECVKRIGRFDETISPGYAYFEDRDYYNRMQEAGIVDAVVQTDVKHGHSQTPASYSAQEWRDHHKRFIVAQENFLKKWGKLPADLERQTYQ